MYKIHTKHLYDGSSNEPIIDFNEWKLTAMKAKGIQGIITKLALNIKHDWQSRFNLLIKNYRYSEIGYIINSQRSIENRNIYYFKDILKDRYCVCIAIITRKHKNDFIYTHALL